MLARNIRIKPLASFFKRGILNQRPKASGTGERENLSEAAFHSLKWRYAGAVLQGTLQFAVGVILARLLSPEDFGIVGMAMIAIGFGKLVGDVGFGAAVIQHPKLTANHIRAALTGSVIVGTVLFCVLWALAPAIARLYTQDTLTPMLRVIGLSLVVSGLSMISVCLMRRQLQFRLLSVIETLSYLLGFGVVGVAMALRGYGAWSLVAANIVQPLSLLVFAAYFGNQSLRPWFQMAEYRDLSRVASAEMLNNMVNFVAENLHFFVIGKWLGAAPLGLFSRSYNLMHLPVKHFSFALSNVMFPIYAKMQDDIPRLRNAFLHTVALTAIVTVPLFLAVAAAPEAIIVGLFGQQWRMGSDALGILCVAGPFMAMMRVFGALSHARGYVFSECGRQVIYLVLVGLSLWLLFPFGLKGLSLAVTLAVIARYMLLAHLCLKLVCVRWRVFFLVQIPGYLFGVVVYLSVYVASVIGEIFLVPDLLRLAIIALAALASLALSYVVFPSSWLGDLYPWLLARFGSALPNWLRRIVLFKSPSASFNLVKSLEAES